MAPVGVAFQQPPMLPDADPTPGQAVYDLTASVQTVEIGPGRRAEMYVYNGSYPGPTLDMQEGEQVVVRVKNALPEATSVHWHGLPVPADQDDALESIAPGATREFRFTVPPGSAGTYWYHPHMHGSVATQVAKGLFGAVRVRAAADPVPAAFGDEIAVLSDPRIGADGRVLGPSGTMEMAMGVEGNALVNGRVAPRLTLRPGEARRVRFLNASSARYYRLQLGDRPLTLLGTDGGLLERSVGLAEVLLAPGERAEVLLRAPEQAGAAPLTLMAAPYDRGAMGMMGQAAATAGKPSATTTANPHAGHAGMTRYGVAATDPMPAMGGMMHGTGMIQGEPLLEVAAEGTPAPAPALPAQLRAIAAFPTAGTTARTFTLSVNHATADIRINGQPFDPKRVAVTTRLGAAEGGACLPPGRAQAAMRRHSSAQRRHSAAQAFISGSSPNLSHEAAHRSQTSAQTPQVRPCRLDPRVMKSAEVWQIWAQSCSNRTWSIAACGPRFIRQWVIVSRQTWWQRVHASMQVRKASIT